MKHMQQENIIDWPDELESLILTLESSEIEGKTFLRGKASFNTHQFELLDYLPKEEMIYLLGYSEEGQGIYVTEPNIKTLNKSENQYEVEVTFRQANLAN